MTIAGWSVRLSVALALSLLVLTDASGQSVIVPFTFAATPSSLGAIPDGPGPGCGVAGAPRDVTFAGVPAAGLSTVRVSITLRHSYAGHLTATLVGPDGSAHVLFGRVGAMAADDCGSPADLDAGGAYVFGDSGADLWATAAASSPVPRALYRTSTMGGSTSGGAITVMATVFTGKNAGGIWTLRLTDSGAGDTGTVIAASLIVYFPLLTDANPDDYAAYSGVPLTIPAPGVLANDTGGLSTVWDAWTSTRTSHGTVTLRADGGFTYTADPDYAGPDGFAYRSLSSRGIAGNGVSIRVASSTSAQPPTNLEVVSVVGRRILLRWDAPGGGLTPTSYLLRSRRAATTEYLGQIRVPASPTAFSFDLPAGSHSIEVDVRTEAGPMVSPVSNFVGLPEIDFDFSTPPPTAPSAVVNGTALTLHWKNRFGSGVPTAAEVVVSGDLNGVVPASGLEWLQVSGVPAGTYTVRVRALNKVGPSDLSPPLAVTIPGVCSSPQTPGRFVAYRTPDGVGVAWDPPPGAAPERYEVVVSNAVSAVVAVGLRRVNEAVVPSGVYEFGVRAVNACGVSPLTGTQTVVVP